MAQIEIKKLTDFPEAEFEVTIRGSTVTKHKVTLAREYYEKLTASVASPEELLEASFAFLLAREPNTSIMSEFSLMVIPKYFPDYEQEIISKIQPDD